MNRRKYLAVTASSVLGSLAGCTSASSSVGDIVEQRSGYSTTEARVSTTTTGRTLLIKPVEGVPVRTHLYQDGEKISSLPLKGVNTPARQELVSCSPEEASGQPFEPGTIELALIGEEGEELGRQDWKFQPQPVVEDFRMATVSDYRSQSHPSETTPIFQLHNIGSGPTCLSDIEITNCQTTVQLGDQRSPLLRTGKFSLTADHVSIHEPANYQSKALLPADRSLYLAIDGLFSVDTGATHTPTDPPKQIEQSFDLVIHTKLGESYTTTISIAMVGGIVQADSKTGQWTHRYRTVRLNGTSPETLGLSD